MSDRSLLMSEKLNTSPLRILQISHDYSGPFTDICRMYNGAFPNANITTLYLRGSESSQVTKATGSDRVIYFGQRQGSLRGIKFSSIFQLAKIFRQNRFDLVIAHRYKAIYLAGIMSYFFTIPLLIGVAHEHSVFKRFTRALFVTFWRRKIQLLAVSDSVAEDILKYCPSLAAQNRVHTIENAIDEMLADQILTRDAARKRLGIQADKFCFATVGRLVEKKDHEVLISAYAGIANENNCLVLVGSGSRESELKKLVHDLGLGDKVIFTGMIADAYQIYCAFDVFVFTSGAKEAFGIVLLEAMLAKVPIICSDARGPKSVVADTALVFKQGDIKALEAQMCHMESVDYKARTNLVEKALDRLRSKYTLSIFNSKLQALPALVKLRSG